MDLIGWELKKILKRRSALIACVAAILYALFLTWFNAYSNLASDIGDQNGKTSGSMKPLEVTRQLNIAQNWQGELTGEKLAKVLATYKEGFAPENIERTGEPYEEVWQELIVPLGTLPEFIYDSFALIPRYSSYYSIPDIPLSMAENYYSNRTEIVSKYIRFQVKDEGDRKFFMAQDAKVKTPFYYDWTDGQQTYLTTMSTVGAGVAIFACIALAPIFAGEYQSGCAALIFSSQRGRRKTAKAKIGAGLSFVAILYIICTAIFIGGQLLFIGPRGLACPIQIIKPIATAPLTVGQVEIYMVVFGFLCCMSISAVCMAISAGMKTPFTAIVLSIACLFLPIVLTGADLTPALSKLVDLFPFAGNYGELFKPNIIHILDIRIWTPWAMLGAQAIITALALPVSYRAYIKHEA